MSDSSSVSGSRQESSVSGRRLGISERNGQPAGPYPHEVRAKAEEVVGRYPLKRSALLPLLHLVSYVDGYVTDRGIALCSELLELTKAEVGAVATFYSMFKREPLGTHLVSVCTNFSCKVRGSQDVFDHLSAKLGVPHNETTADGQFTLEHAECLGNCEGAPIVSVDYLNYELQTPESAAELVDRLAAGDPPPPARGFPPEGVRQSHHRLAGLGPAPEGAHADVGRATDQARAEHGGLPAPDVGPGVRPIPIEPTFTEGQERERAAAKQAVRDAGQDPYDVEADAGPQAREFPTTDPDWEPTREPPERGRPETRSGDESITQPEETHGGIGGDSEPGQGEPSPRERPRGSRKRGDDDEDSGEEGTDG